MPFDLDTPAKIFDKATKAVDRIVEDNFRQKNWRSLLVLIDVGLFLLLNPHQWPFHGLLLFFFQDLEKKAWYAPAFWSLIALIFVAAVAVAARTRRKPTQPPEVKPGAIKGLLP